MKTLRWMWAWYSYQFGGYDFREHQCAKLVPPSKYVTCTRMNHHPGECRNKWDKPQ